MNKNSFATLLLTLLLSMMSIETFAYDFEVDGIYYNLIKGKAAEVTYKGPRSDTGQSYSGDVVIPEKVTYEGVEYPVGSIGEDAFLYCSALTSITIPNSVTSIGGGAFSDCPSLTSVTIPNSVTSIGNSAFYYCKALTSVTLPNSVTSIEESTFASCTGLTSITIPNSVTSIGKGAFNSCSGLTSITIPNSVTSIGYSTFAGCSGLTSITIPNSVTSIGYNAFAGCTSLTSITIPNSVRSIEQSTFSGCTSLTSITIPNSVTSIRSQAFAKCSKLEEVYCLAEKVPSTETDAFQDSYPNYATLYVPASAINDYKTTAPWSQFGTIKAIEGGETQKCATPTISYGNKVLTFSCETEGVEYVYEIKDTDIKKGYDKEVNLSATYEISVYATKSGYENSNVATATLVWTRGTFTETTPDDPTSAKAMQIDTPVLISAHNGLITVKGELDGQPVAVYSAEGKLLGSDSISGGQATISTSLNAGSVAIVKIGQRAVKVVIR